MRLLLAAILVLSLCTAAFGQAEQQAEISVEGSGQVLVTPDQATLMVSVETRSEKASEAAGENARRVRSVIDGLGNLGFGGQDVVTSGYSVTPEWSHDRDGDRELSGYVARNTVQVHLDDLNQVGRVIDASLGAGANRVESLRFSASDIEDAKRAALAEAVRQANSMASVMAEAAGGTLGALIEMRMGRTGPFRPDENAATVYQQPVTPIMPGQVVVMATVHARWEFRKGN
jgi:uncharacterized protein YggE